MVEFYSPTGWAGSKYKEVKKKGLSTVDIAKLIRQDIKKKFPKIKTSIRTQYFSMGSAIDIRIKDPGFNPINPEWNPRDWIGKGYQNEKYTKKGKQILESIKRMAQKYQLHDVDSQTDYFNVSFYLDVDYDTSSEIKWIKERGIRI